MDERDYAGTRSRGTASPWSHDLRIRGRQLIRWVRNDRILLFGLQLAVAALLLKEFLFGKLFFAYVDIGSDTYFQFVPAAMHLAANAGFLGGWSFSVGLGTATGWLPDPFSLLGIAGGAGHVLDLRIWIYLFKIVLGGLALHGFLTTIGTRRDAALIAALAYSFCGQIVSDGQWDPHATEFAVYPLLLWALARQRCAGDLWPIPLAIAFATVCGVFPFSIGIFLGYCCFASVVVSPTPMRALKSWGFKTLPLCGLGFLIAAPSLVPLVFALLDSPRVTGPQAGFSKHFASFASLNDSRTVLVELAGFFHKNLLGIGSRHSGWMNYLEGPGYFTGMLPLLLIPQLWRGNRFERRMLVAGAIAIAAFVAFPAIRSLALGFAIDYFRVNNLWLSLLLLTLFAHSLGVVADKGIDGRLVAASALAIGTLLGILEAQLGSALWLPHAYKILALGGAALTLLVLHAFRLLAWRRLAPAMLAFVAIEAVVIGAPSFYEGRYPVTSGTRGFNDATLPALAAIREHDTGFYRVEKTYDSVSLCDALAQGYRGVKSYWFQNRSTVALYSALAILPEQSRVKNFTNWLPNFGGRIALNSLFGVKYLLADAPINWPGYQPVQQVSGVTIYRNALALPLGFVYERQLPLDQFRQLPPEARDLALLSAVVVDRPGSGARIFDPTPLGMRSPTYLDDNYIAPAQALQRRGFHLASFADTLIRGSVASDIAGTMVFSIPYSRGWAVMVDGKDTPTFEANVGMIAIDLAAGSHQIELRYRTPGLLIGLLGSAGGLVAFAVLVWRRRQTTRSANSRHPS